MSQVAARGSQKTNIFLVLRCPFLLCKINSSAFLFAQEFGKQNKKELVNKFAEIKNNIPQ